MRVELLYFEGCPHVAPAFERLQEAIARLVPGTAIAQVRVESEAQALELRFAGSPSIHIDGVDLEGAQPGPPAMACRLYDGGPPSSWLIEAGILRALAPRHVLFMCVANSARSQMAEGIARALAPEGVRISSAGSEPSHVRPEAVQVLLELGIDATDHRCKGVGDIDAESVDALITLCAEEVCPTFPRPVTRLHWALADPAAVDGSAEERIAAFRRTRDELSRRIERLFYAPALCEERAP